MAASACLRIVLDISEEKLARLDALGPLVAKVTNAFLECYWSWPNRYQGLTPYSFLLVDPKACEVDIARLSHLADELQLKLFGTSGAGHVTLLALDGEESDIDQFVRLDHGRLKALTGEPLKPTPFGGRLAKISTLASANIGPHWRTLQREDAPSPKVVKPAQRVQIGAESFELTFSGVYCAPRRAFVGCGLVALPQDAICAVSLVDGADRTPTDRMEGFDLNCLKAAIRFLQERPFLGVLFLPVSYSAMIRPSTRTAYEQRLASVPDSWRSRLATVVYDVPRSPSFPALTQMTTILRRQFSAIDLQITDAGFEADHLPPGIVNSVTLRLPDTDERQRTAALHRFMQRREAFKRSRIMPAVTNVRTAKELAACLQERALFLSGAAVCGPSPQAIGAIACEPTSLPWRGQEDTEPQAEAPPRRAASL